MALRSSVIGLPLSLPLELTPQIRSYLEPGDIISCSRVSRVWQSYLDTQENWRLVIQQHAIQAPYDIDCQGATNIARALAIIEAHHRGLSCSMPKYSWLHPCLGQHYSLDITPRLHGQFMLRACMLSGPAVFLVDLLTNERKTGIAPDTSVLSIALTETHMMVACDTAVYTKRYAPAEGPLRSTQWQHHLGNNGLTQVGLVALAGRENRCMIVCEVVDLHTSDTGFKVLLIDEDGTVIPSWLDRTVTPLDFTLHAAWLLHDRFVFAHAACTGAECDVYLWHHKSSTGETSYLTTRMLTKWWFYTEALLQPSGPQEALFTFYGHAAIVRIEPLAVYDLGDLPSGSALWRGRFYQKLDGRIFSTPWLSGLPAVSFSHVGHTCYHGGPADQASILLINDVFLVDCHVSDESIEEVCQDDCCEHGATCDKGEQPACRPYHVYSFDPALPAQKQKKIGFVHSLGKRAKQERLETFWSV